MLFAFIAMRAFGVSGNLMSLGAIDFGLIVDGAVVMVENAVRLIARAPQARRGDRRARPRSSRAPAARSRGPSSSRVGDHHDRLPADPGAGGHRGEDVPADGADGRLRARGVARLSRSPSCRCCRARVPARRVAENESLALRRRAHGLRPLLGAVLRAGARVTVARRRCRLRSRALGARPVPRRRVHPQPRRGRASRSRSAAARASRSRSRSAQTTRLEKVAARAVPRGDDGRLEDRAAPRSPPTRWASRSPTSSSCCSRPSEWRSTPQEELVEAIDAALDAERPGPIFSYSQPIELRVTELIAGVRSDVAIKLYRRRPRRAQRTRRPRSSASVARVPGAADVKAEQTAGPAGAADRIDRARSRATASTPRTCSTRSRRSAGATSARSSRGSALRLQVRFAPERAQRRRGDPRACPIRAPDGRAGPARRARRPRASRTARRRSAARPASAGSPSSSTCAGATSAASSPRRRRAIDREVKLPPATASTGAASSRTSRARPRAWRRSCPSRCSSSSCCCYIDVRLGPAGAAHLPRTCRSRSTGGIVALALRGMPFSISAGVGLHRALRRRGAQRGRAHRPRAPPRGGRAGRPRRPSKARAPAAARPHDRAGRGARLRADGARDQRGRRGPAAARDGRHRRADQRRRC